MRSTVLASMDLPEKPAQQIIISPDISGTANKPPRQKRNYILWGFLIFIALIVLLVVMFIMINNAHEKAAKAKQREDFNAAVARCGQDPAVVVEHHTNIIETITTTSIYSSVNPDYETQKYIYDTHFGGHDKVRGYYCTIEEAVAANRKYGAEDSTDNYTPEQRAAITKDLLQKYAEQYGTTLYQVDASPATLKFDQLRIWRKNPNNKQSFYEPYTFEYKLVSAPESTLDKIRFRCGEAQTYDTPGWINPSRVNEPDLPPKTTLFDTKKLALSTRASQITGTYIEVENSGHAWEISLVGGRGKKPTTCGLYDTYNLITKEEGDAMIGSLKELDLNNLPDIEFYFF